MDLNILIQSIEETCNTSIQNELFDDILSTINEKKCIIIGKLQKIFQFCLRCLSSHLVLKGQELALLLIQYTGAELEKEFKQVLPGIILNLGDLQQQVRKKSQQILLEYIKKVKNTGQIIDEIVKSGLQHENAFQRQKSARVAFSLLQFNQNIYIQTQYQIKQIIENLIKLTDDEVESVRSKVSYYLLEIKNMNIRNFDIIFDKLSIQQQKIFDAVVQKEGLKVRQMQYLELYDQNQTDAPDDHADFLAHTQNQIMKGKEYEFDELYDTSQKVLNSFPQINNLYFNILSENELLDLFFSDVQKIIIIFTKFHDDLFQLHIGILKQYVYSIYKLLCHLVKEQHPTIFKLVCNILDKILNIPYLNQKIYFQIITPHLIEKLGYESIQIRKNALQILRKLIRNFTPHITLTTLSIFLLETSIKYANWHIKEEILNLFSYFILEIGYDDNLHQDLLQASKDIAIFLDHQVTKVKLASLNCLGVICFKYQFIYDIIHEIIEQNIYELIIKNIQDERILKINSQGELILQNKQQLIQNIVDLQHNIYQNEKQNIQDSTYQQEDQQQQQLLQLTINDNVNNQQQQEQQSIIFDDINQQQKLSMIYDDLNKQQQKQIVYDNINNQQQQQSIIDSKQQQQQSIIDSKQQQQQIIYDNVDKQQQLLFESIKLTNQQQQQINNDNQQQQFIQDNNQLKQQQLLLQNNQSQDLQYQYEQQQKINENDNNLQIIQDQQQKQFQQQKQIKVSDMKNLQIIDDDDDDMFYNEYYKNQQKYLQNEQIESNRVLNVINDLFESDDRQMVKFMIQNTNKYSDYQYDERQQINIKTKIEDDQIKYNMSYKPQIEFSSKTYQPLNLLQDEQQKKTIKPKTQEQIMQEFIVNNENQMDKDNQKIVKNNYIFDHLNDIQPLAAPQISAAYITIQLESSDIEQVFYNLNSKEIDALNSVRKICKFDVEILYSQLIDLGHVVQLVTEKINSQSINVAITALVCIMELVQSLKRALDPYAGNIIQSGFDSFKQYRNESFMILQMAAQNLNENKILQYIYKSWDYQKEPQNMHQIAILFDIIISKVKEQIINSKEFYTFVRILAHLQVDQSLVIRKLARKILYKLLLTGLNKSKFKENIRLILPEYLYLKMTELIDKQEELEKEVQLNDEKPDEIQLKKKVYIPYNKRNN